MPKFTIELNERDIRLLRIGLYERRRAILRKRSWRPSEKAVAMADCTMLDERLTALLPPDDNAGS